MKRSFDDCFAYDRELIPVADAIDRLKSNISCAVGSSPTPLNDTNGRYLAAPLISSRHVPAFDNVAVDGWAVRHQTAMIETALTLPIHKGRATAGHPYDQAVPEGHALRVLTGAVLPDGVDTVILQEECHVDGDSVLLPAGINKGANCRPKGEDIKDGETVLPTHHRLRPQDVGTAALMGFGAIQVFDRLKVAVFSTGDEVMEPGSPHREGGVYDANRPMLKSLLATLPVTVTDMGRLTDDQTVVEKALVEAAQTHDVVITSGGASQGDEDHIASTLNAHGSLHFWRIALKPGRPMAFGQIDLCLFIGLPGNPVASFVCFNLFARPMMTVLGGGSWQEPFTIPVALGAAIKKRPGRLELVRATLERNTTGLVAHKIKKQGSGVLTSLVEADGLIQLDHDLVDPVEGTPVPFWPFEALI